MRLVWLTFALNALLVPSSHAAEARSTRCPSCSGRDPQHVFDETEVVADACAFLEVLRGPSPPSKGDYYFYLGQESKFEEVLERSVCRFAGLAAAVDLFQPADIACEAWISKRSLEDSPSLFLDLLREKVDTFLKFPGGASWHARRDGNVWLVSLVARENRAIAVFRHAALLRETDVSLLHPVEIGGQAVDELVMEWMQRLEREGPPKAEERGWRLAPLQLEAPSSGKPR